MKIYYLISFVVIALDQWTKSLAVTELANGFIKVTDYFSLILAYNKGAAFSFLSDAGGWQRWFFTAVAVAVSAVLVVWIYRLKQHEKLLAIALALVLGGAIGNVYDRIMLGHVVDFILVHYQDNYFPAFNIADSAISVGAALLILDAFLQGKKTGE
jgi:signal peptidase II|tara:strand:+ start:5134 stop:5601 length:468 start_codon:yes stop_codon:yes gene_type:complete